MPLFNPVPAFDFTVMMIDAKPPVGAAAIVGVVKSVLLGGFSEVSGLNAEMETEEYREGGRNGGPHKLVKWGKFPNLVFKRGVTMNADLWDWHDSVARKGGALIRKNGMIMLTDRGAGVSSAFGGPTGLGLPGTDRPPAAVWFFQNALPERIQGPQLNAKSNEIAIETLELSHEGLYRLGPGMLPGIVGDVATSMGF